MMKFKIYLVLGILIAGLGAALGIAISKYKKAVKEREQAIEYSLSKQDSLEYVKTKLGQESARTEVLELTVANLRRLQHDKDLAWIKQIEGVNKRMNNVEQIMTTTAKVVGNFKIGLRDTIIYTLPDTGKTLNSVRALAFNNHDKWFTLKGYVTPDTLVATPELFVPLQSVVYWQRKKLILGIRMWPAGREWYKQTTSPNPYVKITFDELIRVSKKPR